MMFAKRIGLFLITNIAIMLTASFVLSLLGVGRYLGPMGMNYGALMAFCLVWGFVGAFVSLLLSRFMAKMMMGVKVIDPNAPGELGEYVRSVHNLARAAGLPAMPEVGIYESPEVNAFATGPSKSRALVAVSTGLLHRMNREERDAVLGHEIAHIANGDMVTMTLIQGVVNAFVMFLSRVAAFAISTAIANRNSDDRESSSPSPMLNWVLTMVFEIVLGLVGAMIVAWFSRQREYRADAGGARYAGRENMIKALQALQRTTQLVDDGHSSLATLKISGRRGGFLALLSSHPPLEERIQRLALGR